MTVSWSPSSVSRYRLFHRLNTLHVHWSTQPRVIRCLPSLLFLLNHLPPFQMLSRHQDSTALFLIRQINLLYFIVTENGKLCQLCRHWWHRRLLSWHSSIPPVTAKLASWLFLNSPTSTKNVTECSIWVWVAYIKDVCFNSRFRWVCRFGNFVNSVRQIALSGVRDEDMGLSAFMSTCSKYPIM